MCALRTISSSRRTFNNLRIYRASVIGVPSQMSTRRSATSGWHQRRAQRHHVRAVVLAGVARDRFVDDHGRPDAAHFVGGNGGPDAGAIDRDARVRLAARDRFGDRAGGIGIVHRRRPVHAEVVHRDPLAAQVLHDRLPQRHAGVIAARSRRAGSATAGARSAGIAGSTEPCRHDGDPPLTEGVLRQRGDVPALGELHRRAGSICRASPR